MNRKKKKSHFLEKAIIAVAGCIVLPISLYQTAKGYEEAGMLIAWGMSIVFTLILILFNKLLFDRLEKNNGVGWVLVGFFSVVIFTFAGNFNSIYSNYMKKELRETEVKEFEANIFSLKGKAIEKISNTHDTEDFKNKISQLRNKLTQQIKNPGNPGVGDVAKGIIGEINVAFGNGVELTEMFPEPNLTGSNKYERWAQLYEDQINQILDSEIALRPAKANKAIAEIDSIFNYIQLDINQTKENPRLLNNKGGIIIDKICKGHNDIGSIAQSFLGAENFEYNTIQSSHSEIGKISHSFESGFSRVDNFFGTLWSTLLSLGLDFILPFVIFIVFVLIYKDENQPLIIEDGPGPVGPKQI